MGFFADTVSVSVELLEMFPDKEDRQKVKRFLVQLKRLQGAISQRQHPARMYLRKAFVISFWLILYGLLFSRPLGVRAIVLISLGFYAMHALYRIVAQKEAIRLMEERVGKMLLENKLFQKALPKILEVDSTMSEVFDSADPRPEWLPKTYTVQFRDYEDE